MPASQVCTLEARVIQCYWFTPARNGQMKTGENTFATEVRFRSFIGSRWGVPTQFADSTWLSSHLICTAPPALLAELVTFRSSTQKDKLAFISLIKTEEQVGECPYHNVAATSWEGRSSWKGSSWREKIQSGSIESGCRCPDEIQQQALMFNLFSKMQRNLFSLY